MADDGEAVGSHLDAVGFLDGEHLAVLLCCGDGHSLTTLHSIVEA